MFAMTTPVSLLRMLEECPRLSSSGEHRHCQPAQARIPGHGPHGTPRRRGCHVDRDRGQVQQARWPVAVRVEDANPGVRGDVSLNRECQE
jgi:hypothetical protein